MVNLRFPVPVVMRPKLAALMLKFAVAGTPKFG